MLKAKCLICDLQTNIFQRPASYLPLKAHCVVCGIITPHDANTLRPTTPDEDYYYGRAKEGR